MKRWVYKKHLWDTGTAPDFIECEGCTRWFPVDYQFNDVSIRRTDDETNSERRIVCESCLRRRIGMMR